MIPMACNDAASPLEPADWQILREPRHTLLQAYAPTLDGAFAAAAAAVGSLLGDGPGLRALQPLHLQFDAAGPEQLLLEWVDRLAHEATVRGMGFARFTVAVDTCRLHATAWGEALDAASAPRPRGLPEGARQARVRRLDDGRWLAQCRFGA